MRSPGLRTNLDPALDVQQAGPRRQELGVRGGGGCRVPRYPAPRSVSCSWEGPWAPARPSQLPGKHLRTGRPGAGGQGPHHSPSLATSPMGTLCFWAMYPRKEKTTKPEEKLVSELTEVVMIASLRNKTGCPSRAPLQFPVIIANWLSAAGGRGALPRRAGRPACDPRARPGLPCGGRLAPSDSGEPPTRTPR